MWRTGRPSALKVHERESSYRAERNAYMRFRDVGLTDVNGFAVPKLVGHADDLLALEMSIVFPPFVVDFASVVLDVDPELIEDDGHTIADLVRERFGADRVAAVLGVREELIGRAGAYLSDLHGHNIKFGGGVRWGRHGLHGSGDFGGRGGEPAGVRGGRAAAAGAGRGGRRRASGLRRWRRSWTGGEVGIGRAGWRGRDVPYLLGAVWGGAVVAGCDGWAWAEVVFRRHGDVPAVGVVSADRSMALFPIHAVAGLMEGGGDGGGAIVAVFEQVRDGRLGGFEPGGYVNVMDVGGG